MSHAQNWKFGMSSCSTGDLSEQTFRAYAENGVELMEVSPKTEDYATLNWNETVRLSRQYNVPIWSFHLAFAPFETNDISSCDASLRRKSVEFQSEHIKRAADVGVSLFVIHPSGEPIADEERTDRLSASMESLHTLSELAVHVGGVLAVEDLPRTCLGNSITEIQTLLTAHDALRACLDTNHLLCDYNVDFVKAIGSKIATLHVSDYDYRNERHWLPYEGKVDWIALVTELEKADYNGPLMYEISLASPPSIARGRDLAFADFAENYKALVEKRPIDLIGMPDSEHINDWVFYETPHLK